MQRKELRAEDLTEGPTVGEKLRLRNALMSREVMSPKLHTTDASFSGGETSSSDVFPSVIASFDNTGDKSGLNTNDLFSLYALLDDKKDDLFSLHSLLDDEKEDSCCNKL